MSFFRWGFKAYIVTVNTYKDKLIVRLEENGGQLFFLTVNCKSQVFINRYKACLSVKVSVQL